MSVCTIVVPTLGRPANLARLEQSFRTIDHGAPCDLMLVCSATDRPSVNMAESLAGDHVTVLRVPYEPGGRGDQAVKLNAGALLARGDWILACDDDCVFHDGWLREALKAARKTGAKVIGTNDLGNKEVLNGVFSTHPLFHRDYLELGTIDQPRRLYHEGYWHQCTDREAAETAKARGLWAYAPEAVVEHLHHAFGKADPDDVYAIADEHYADDKRLFEARRRLWEPVAA